VGYVESPRSFPGGGKFYWISAPSTSTLIGMNGPITHILIVEDEPAIADTLSYALEAERFEVSHCLTGGEALQNIVTSSYSLVILDVGLPDMSGFEVCKQIRRTSQLPIIMLTARAEEIDRIVGLEIGADDYVTKPFSPRELVARVKAILRRTQHHHEHLSVNEGPFALDEAACLISFKGVDLMLSRYEFGILQLLISSPNQVFSRQQIMDAVWSEPEASFDRAVDTHIKTVREKLRQIDAEIDPIKTRRGLGYLYQTAS